MAGLAARLPLTQQIVNVIFIRDRAVVARAARTMYVCICRRVSDREVRQVVESGAQSVDAVGERCGAGTDCGSCHDEIADLICEHRAARSAGVFRALGELSLQAA